MYIHKEKEEVKNNSYFYVTCNLKTLTLPARWLERSGLMGGDIKER